MKYASETSVSVEKSKAEIEATVNRYGATGFASGWQGNKAMVMFEMNERRLKFTLPLPDKHDKAFTETPHRGHRRSPEQALVSWEQACRQKWRALALVIKAKLEAVESDISTFDSEFMAQIVLPTDLTVGETILPDIDRVLAGGKLPPLLPDYSR